jgi:predicted DNA-binding ribbon-helix-helix protein
MGRGRPRASQLPLASIQIEPVIWEALKEIAALQARSVDDLVMEIARDSLAVALRVYVVEWLRTEDDDPSA